MWRVSETARSIVIVLVVIAERFSAYSNRVMWGGRHIHTSGGAGFIAGWTVFVSAVDADRILVRRQLSWGDILLVRLEVSSEDPAPILELHHWLRLDPDARRFADPKLVAPDTPEGAMGAVDVINLVLSQGFSAANLALAYASWRNVRPAAPSVTIIRDGGSIVVTDASVDTVRQIVEYLSAGDGVREDARRGESGRSPEGGR
jgi:hypothetical protein